MSRSPLVGAVLLLAVLGTALVAGGPARDELMLLMSGAAAAFLAGALLPRRAVACTGLLLGAGTAVAVLGAPDGLSGAPLAGPLGYGNANGALCAQGVAACALAALRGGRLVRLLAVVLALVLLLLGWQTASAAGLVAAGLCALGGLLLAGSPPDRRARAARAVVLLAGAAVGSALLTTVALGAAHDADAPRDGALTRLVDRGLSERRVVLWSEALDLLGAEPVRGVGLGRFAEQSPTARRDADARWAHSAFLQHGAETGAPGLLALLGLTGWVFAVLHRAAGRDPAAAVGALAAAALLGHASLDYVLHFPSVPVLAAVILGMSARAERVGGVAPARGRAAGCPTSRRRPAGGTAGDMKHGPRRPSAPGG